MNINEVNPDLNYIAIVNTSVFGDAPKYYLEHLKFNSPLRKHYESLVNDKNTVKIIETKEEIINAELKVCKDALNNGALSLEEVENFLKKEYHQ